MDHRGRALSHRRSRAGQSVAPGRFRRVRRAAAGRRRLDPRLGDVLGEEGPKPSDLLKTGEMVEAIVLGVNAAERRISLG
jgi:hypothetical protein